MVIIRFKHNDEVLFVIRDSLGEAQEKYDNAVQRNLPSVAFTTQTGIVVVPTSDVAMIEGRR